MTSPTFLAENRSCDTRNTFLESSRSIYPFANYQSVRGNCRLRRTSYSLLFSRDHASRKIAKELFAAEGKTVTFTGRIDLKPYPRSVTITEWEIYSRQTPMLQHFEYYQAHFAFLQFEMERWRSRTIKDLLEPEYRGGMRPCSALSSQRLG